MAVRILKNMHYEKTIFSFWEPTGSMTPYLELCVRTWKRNLPGYEIIFLDYSNLGNYLPEGTYEMTVLKRLPLMMQKDAVMVAVLKEHGGIFMDADTLVKRGQVHLFLIFIQLVDKYIQKSIFRRVQGTCPTFIFCYSLTST
jgi:mannosyltransferase OCH1-like enzyme